MPPPEAIPGTTPAPEPRHPIRGYPAEACTTQLGVTGPWQERLPHFRLDHRPSAGAELQSEYFVDRADAPAALAALAALADRLAPLTLVTEVRTVAADRHWLSPACGRDSATFHFTWAPDWPAVRSVLPEIERALEPFDPRPHWAKLFTLSGAAVRDRYPDRHRFIELAGALDPDGAFRNDFLDSYVFGRALVA
jgi:alditol oxidase